MPFQITDFGGALGREGGTGDLEIGLKRNLGYNLDTGNIFSVGAEVIVPTGDDEVALRAALGRTWTTGGPFGRAWTPMLEVLGSRDLESGADIEWDLVPQFQVTLNTRQHVMANFGLRIPTENEPGRDTQFVFYLLWDWFDGGVLEGW